MNVNVARLHHDFSSIHTRFIGHLFPCPPPAPNPCAANEGLGPCSHLCLINYHQSFSCACPHLMKLGPDRRTCYESRQFLLYARQIEIRGVDIDNPYYNYIIFPPCCMRAQKKFEIPRMAWTYESTTHKLCSHPGIPINL
ncbi:hypothetical protein CRUP_036405 [Coryphaenoides rupestris]|nr:hypothetical protein CRUP_036405 [Coryphaenoides rupestris]